jgi:hypothetical protein
MYEFPQKSHSTHKKHVKYTLKSSFKNYFKIGQMQKHPNLKPPLKI